MLQAFRDVGALGCMRGVGVEFPQYFQPRLLNIDVKVLQHSGCDTITFTKQAQENMLGPNVRVIESLGFLGGEREDFLDPRGVRGARYAWRGHPRG